MTLGRDLLAPALDAWRAAVGSKHVVADPANRAAAGRATYGVERSVAAVLHPADTAEVQACVRIAARFGVPLYPVSSGRNWGYGSRTPTGQDHAILDLGRLNRILSVEEDLAFAVIEPGVTQRQLHAHLQARHGGRLWIDATSSSLDSSLIGNALERGHGGTAYCDHVAHLTDLEVVLANGEVLRTGFGAFPAASPALVDAWGLGPALNPLFSQSALGVVTRGVLHLMRAPERSGVMFFRMDDDAALARTVERVRPLRLDQILKSGPFIGNVYQSLQKVMTYPWTATGGTVPLPPRLAAELAAPHAYGAWNGSVGLYGTAEEVALQSLRLRQALHGAASWTAWVDAESEAPETQFPPSRHREVRAVIAGLSGGVAGTSLPAAYWRVGGRPDRPGDPDLDADGCGFKFWSATAPFRGHDAVAAARIAADTILDHGFEPSIGIFPVRDRSLKLNISCAYDRSRAGHDDAMSTCHAELAQRLLAAGYPPNRLGVEAMGIMDAAGTTHRDVLRAMKQAFDPAGILAPGRYLPGSPTG